MRRSRPVVAIDGPAGSGKSTTARAVAVALGFAHLDSGALYRAVTLVALEAGGEPSGWRGAALAALARERDVSLRWRGATGGAGKGAGDGGVWEVAIRGSGAGDALRTPDVTRHVSAVAAMPEVRAFVNQQLRRAAAGGGVVVDGRDIGTAVFPDAEVKIFLVADAAERARRRLLERREPVDPAAVRAETAALERRDALDSSREAAPLARPADAVVVDTTRLSFDEQVRTVVDHVRRVAKRLDRTAGRG